MHRRKNKSHPLKVINSSKTLEKLPADTYSIIVSKLLTICSIFFVFMYRSAEFGLQVKGENVKFEIKTSKGFAIVITEDRCYKSR